MSKKGKVSGRKKGEGNERSKTVNCKKLVGLSNEICGNKTKRNETKLNEMEWLLAGRQREAKKRKRKRERDEGGRQGIRVGWLGCPSGSTWSASRLSQ